MTVLSPAREVLARLSAVLAARDPDALRTALRDAAETADPAAVEEAIIQSYLFLGYPIALEAMAVWREVSGQPAPIEHDGSAAAWAERGERVCATVYGGQYGRLRENVRALHPDMERWMVEEGYGKVLGRPGLDLPTRELCVVAVLAVLDAPRQLYSHLRGALNAGAGPEEVEAVLTLALEWAGDGARRTGIETWDAVLARSVGG